MQLFASKAAIWQFADKLLMLVTSEMAALTPEQRYHFHFSVLHTHCEEKVIYNV